MILATAFGTWPPYACSNLVAAVRAWGFVLGVADFLHRFDRVRMRCEPV